MKPCNVQQKCVKLMCMLYLCLNSALPAASSACQCIRIKDCVPFTQLLLHHSPAARSAVFAVVHAASCGFQGLDPLVCCPSEQRYYRYESEPLRMMRFAGPHDRWVWEIKPRAGFAPNMDYKHEMNLHDYHDFMTQRNCPLALDNEFDGEQFGHRHHIHYQIEHDAQQTDDALVLAPKQPRIVLVDRPIVFPGDSRYQKANKKKTRPPAKPTQLLKITDDSADSLRAATRRNNTPNCGISLNARVLGGQPAAPGQFSWLARIAYRNRTNNRIGYRCSGSLISGDYILTAAHCVVNLVNDLELSHVRIGDDSFNANDCAPADANCTTPNLFAISRVIVHPNYDQPKYANDIALLRINSTQNNFTAICLPLNNTAALADRLIGQTGLAAGWSTSNVENSAGLVMNNSTVRFIRMPIVNTTSCAMAYASLSESFRAPIMIMPSHLCAQGEFMNDVCRGDSGGPFMDDGSTGAIGSDGRYTLLGIVSFGPTLCGAVTTIPGVYTRVSAYTDWIFSSMSATQP